MKDSAGPGRRWHERSESYWHSATWEKGWGGGEEGIEGGKQLVKVSLYIHSLCIPSRKLCTGTKFI